MGYYSIYRIFKDIIKTLFGRKFFKYIIIILIAFTIFFMLGVKGVFASYDLSGSNDVTYKLPDAYSNYNYVIVIKPTRSWDWTFIYGSNKPFVVSNSSTTSTFNVGFAEPSVSYIYSQQASVTGSNLSNLSTTTATSPANGSNGFYSLSGNLSYNEIVVTTFDLKKVNGETFISNTNISYPEITTPLSDLQTLNFDYISINANDWTDKTIYALFYDRNNMTTESTQGLYPIKEIPLSKQFYSEYLNDELSTNSNSVFWIPNNATGLYFVKNGNYEIRLAERIYHEDGGGGFRDENDNYSYCYLGDTITFTVSDTVSQDRIDLLNNATKENEEKERHDETIGAINKQTDQDNEFYNSILSNEYDQNQAGDTLTGVTGSTDNIDYTEYTGLFSAIFGKFSSIINGDYSSVERIEYPIPNTNGKIVVTSDLLSSKIQGTFIYVLLQSFWLFLFGMYIFKFSNNLIRKIKSGSILNGYENNDEVITSSML